LYTEYKDRGFTILGFPCNQFGHQEPGNNEEILAFATENYGATFPLFSKIRVNGAHTDPLWRFLKVKTKSTFGQSIKWNFTKFLINREGIPVDRYSPASDPFDIRDAIVKLLDSPAP